jgi:SAM-dependent methyltransferase
MADRGLRRDAPATHRNREAILEVLKRWLIGPARVLEIASGTGQHAAYFAGELPHACWQPSDFDPASLASISAWTEGAGLTNVLAPVVLDASSPDWPSAFEPFDALFNANMIHISPWSVAEGLFLGAGRALHPGGILFLYGPFKIGGVQTAPSNAAFDESLKERDPRWGIRDLESVIALGDAHGIAHLETNDLPANNKMAVFRRA